MEIKIRVTCLQFIALYSHFSRANIFTENGLRCIYEDLKKLTDVDLTTTTLDKLYVESSVKGITYSIKEVQKIIGQKDDNWIVAINTIDDTIISRLGENGEGYHE